MRILNYLEQKLNLGYPKYAALKYQHVDAKVADIQKLLDDKTALLEYVIGDSVVYIFYIDKNSIKWFEQPLSNKELNLKIKLLHRTLSDYSLLAKNAKKSYDKYTSTAYWFYQTLVDSALKEAKGVENLIIVTDGELGHLPFESFLVEPVSQKETDYSSLDYLINHYSISYNYSATLWKENRESAKTTNNGQVFAMASNYDIELDSSRIDSRLPTYLDIRRGLNALPEARKEVELLSEGFNGVFAFDKNASEKSFKEQAGDYAIIHLAMHGLLDSKRPLLSTLVFTEDSDSAENNFLQAYEISKMKLNADLVILSACETGFGKFEAGNGIASLARAFMYAGASSLVVSLWQVNDYATSVIMKNLYQNLVRGQGKAEALRQAKLDYIRVAGGIAAHPAFWSPFIQIGNADAVHISKKGELM